MKILIFGASGSGTTTLGKALAVKINHAILDADDFYWKKTPLAFSEKTDIQERKQNLVTAFEKYNDVIISGSLVSWGEYWLTAFDLVIFLFLPKDIRMDRLKNRELERYGDALLTDELLKKNSTLFLDWAAQYDDDDFKGRSKRIHLDWLNLLTCKVLKIEGNIELNKRLEQALYEINNF